MKTCPRCGSPNDDKTVNCAYCGVALPAAAPPPPPVQIQIQNTIYAGRPAPRPSPATAVDTGPFAGWRPWWKILGWALCFPLMLTLIAAKRKTRSWYVFAVIGWIVYVIWVATAPRKGSAPVSPTLSETALMTARLSFTPTPLPTLTTLPAAAAFVSNTPPARISIETMPGIESWKADAFFEEFSALTGYAIPEAYAGEEGYSRRAYDADNGSCRTDYHVTENDAGKVAEAFFNFDTGCPRDWLAEIAALTSVGADYQKELVGFIKSFDGKKAIENIYGDGWYKVDTGGNGETVQLIIRHFQYDEYLDASSGL